MLQNLVPPNTKGKPNDLEFSVTLPSTEAASKCFDRAAKRMLNPPVWHELAGWASAHFILVGPTGKVEHRLAEEGDFLRIDIPGPGPSAGTGYDWVRVEMLEYHKDPDGGKEWIGMRVRPCGEPGKSGVGTAHFFQSDATSTYIIERVGEKVTAWYHGRNEVANTTTDKILDNIRNAVVAAGALVSFSEIQWAALSKGFLAEEIGR